MPEPCPEYHFHDDFRLTPAYALGYGFHALRRVDETTSVHGRRGAVALLTELLGTLTALKLDASLAAAEPLRMEQEAISRRPRTARVGAPSAAQLLAALTVVEEAVRAELHLRGVAARPVSGPPSASLRAVLGEAALERCPEALRGEVTDACRALDANLYTAAVFHGCRVWDQLPGPVVPPLIAGDPRTIAIVRCSRADAVNLLGAIRIRLEG